MAAAVIAAAPTDQPTAQRRPSNTRPIDVSKQDRTYLSNLSVKNDRHPAYNFSLSAQVRK